MRWDSQGPMPQYGAQQSYSAAAGAYTYAVTETDEGFYASYRLRIVATRATFFNDGEPYSSLREAKSACEKHAAQCRAAT